MRSRREERGGNGVKNLEWSEDISKLFPAHPPLEVKLTDLYNRETMDFFFLKDYRHNYRFFSTESVHQIQVEFSRLKKIWELAKQKLMLLPPRILRQEQAFARILQLEGETIQIYHSGDLSEKKIKRKFYFYLQRQRSKHILLLIIETILLPVSGLMMLLPGPNVFFGVLALIMITHWQAYRGIHRLSKQKPQFLTSPLLAEWQQVLENEDEKKYLELIKKIEKEYSLENIQKILYKT